MFDPQKYKNIPKCIKDSKISEIIDLQEQKYVQSMKLFRELRKNSEDPEIAHEASLVYNLSQTLFGRDIEIERRMIVYRITKQINLLNTAFSNFNVKIDRKN